MDQTKERKALERKSYKTWRTRRLTQELAHHSQDSLVDSHPFRIAKSEHTDHTIRARLKNSQDRKK